MMAKNTQTGCRNERVLGGVSKALLKCFKLVFCSSPGTISRCFVHLNHSHLLVQRKGAKLSNLLLLVTLKTQMAQLLEAN